MKSIRRISSAAMALLFCFFTVTATHAAFIWDEFYFRYAVDENSADIYSMNIDRFNPIVTLQGPTLQSTNTDDETDPVNSRVDSSNPTDPTNLGLQLNAGTGGWHLSDGVRIEGYAVTSTSPGGVLFPYAVGSPGSQKVYAFSNRNFHVDSNQAAILSCMAGGVIDDPEFSGGQFLFADYNWQGGVTLDEIVIRQGVPLILNSWFINFNDLLNDGPKELLVNLRTQDYNGDPISYTLRTQLDLETQFINYDLSVEYHAGDIPVGALGSLGDLDDPLWIEGTITPALSQEKNFPWEIIGTWSSGIRYWDFVVSIWTQMTPYITAGDIAAGDFTGDGKADVASIWGSDGLWYQDGATLAWIKIDNWPPDRVAAGDVTGDGRDEIIGTWSSGIWYWDFVASTWTQMTPYITTGDIAAGDFTGDGKADVASIWGSDGLWYQDGATLAWIKIDNWPPDRVAAGDVTGDGRDEIIGTWSNGIWYYDLAKSKWTQMTSYATDGDIAAGDFTGDGKADVASIWGSDGLWYQDGATLGWTKVSDSAPNSLTAGDVTGD